MSRTRDSVSSAIQTPRISSKKLRCASYFQFCSRCLDIPMKNCRSCLIYYIVIGYSLVSLLLICLFGVFFQVFAV